MTTETETAAGPWRKIAKGSKPAPGRSYLICADYGGVRTCDVAFFRGHEKDGTPRWILADVEIDQRCIEFFAEISEPVEPTARVRSSNGEERGDA